MFLPTATPVTIGLQQTAYSVYETDEYQVVCAEVLSGGIARRNITIDYKTTSDTASMYIMLKNHWNLKFSVFKNALIN